VALSIMGGLVSLMAVVFFARVRSIRDIVAT